MGSAAGQLVRDHKNKVVLSIMHQFGSKKPVKRGSCQGELGDVKLRSAKNVKVLCKQGLLKEALEIMHLIEKRMDCSIYVYLLQGCAKVKALSEGKLVHAHMNETGFVPDSIW
ncbi:hypothetical protein SUGI_0610070 [Cryptomeria japonica]|nr:hypothetical protein SUGI_0610070 [Cryptomeria japonica]